MKKILQFWLALALFLPGAVFAWPYPPASGIVYTTNGLSHITNTTLTVQGLIDWLDDNTLFTGAGYVTAASLATTLSSTSTQKFGQVSVNQGPTNAYVRLGTYYGFVATMTNAAVSALTNVSLYGAVTNIVIATYNPQAWYSTSALTFTPLIEGYYMLGAEVEGTTTCRVQIVSYNSNQVIKVGNTDGTNKWVNGSGIVYANGTSTNTYYLEALAIGVSNTFTHVKFYGNYLGR